MRKANYRIVSESLTHIIIQDMGPWDQHPTITNAAEEVVAELSPRMLNGQKLLYYDSEGQVDELIVKNGQFAGFAPGPKS